MPLSKEAAMSRKIQFVCLIVLLGFISTALQSAFAQDAATAQMPSTFEKQLFCYRRLRGRRRQPGWTGEQNLPWLRCGNNLHGGRHEPRC